ncbi:MAG: lipoyl(octanoyl) transferase [Roseateles depolymerans]|uniref:Octanoyltransferase n=1 Tax=Roseateles depolymerans TaxID=76731 RepID=A0A2W5DG71_9BURK|nr:MAG: lipoyl(octanoyl) transferase [Roseateles depolymerans]
MIVKTLGRVDYLPTLEAMRAFTAARSASDAEDQPDELWLCEHPPTFTQGLAGKPEHLLLPGDIPVVATERGGQVTFHGPGQVTAYPLVNLRRLGIYVKEYVYRLETALIQTLDSYGVTGLRVAGAPGIYVRTADPGAHAALAGPADPSDPFKGLAKIAALGIKVSNHRTFHGLALNVAMDLQPFQRINPCGYAGLETTSLDKIGVFTDWSTAAGRLAERLSAQLTP